MSAGPDYWMPQPASFNDGWCVLPFGHDGLCTDGHGTFDVTLGHYGELW